MSAPPVLRRTLPLAGAVVVLLAALTGCGSTPALQGGAVAPAASGAAVARAAVDGGAASASASGAATAVVDSGFDVVTDGFAFRNYGNENAPRNLDATSMQAVFGDSVCARVVEGVCSLTAASTGYMQALNDSMDGGHCFGMAAAAQLIQGGAVDPAVYGGDTTAQLPESTAVQSLIARYMASQFGSTVKAQESRHSVQETVDLLTQGWATGEDYVLGIFTEGTLGGHAITPTSVHHREDGTVEIKVYDNNFPAVEQSIQADPRTDTWTYSTAANPADDPDTYVGSPDNQLELTPISATVGVQDCPICQANKDHRTLIMVKDRTGDLPVGVTVTGPDGGDPDAEVVDALTDSQSTVVSVGSTEPFTIDLVAGEGSEAGDVDIAVIGPGWVQQVRNASLSAGQADTLSIDPQRHSLTWTSSGDAAPVFTSSADAGQVSYGVTATVPDLAPGTSFTLSTDPETAGSTVEIDAPTERTYPVTIDLLRTDATADATLTAEPVDVTTGQTLILNYADWDGSAVAPIPGTVTRAGRPDAAMVLQGH